MFSLVSMFPPGISGCLDRVIQSGLDEDSVDGSVTDRCDVFDPVVSQVSFNLAWSPVFVSSQF